MRAVDHLLEERATLVQDRGVTVSGPDTGSLAVAGDKLLIQQAVANLLDNALDTARKAGRCR